MKTYYYLVESKNGNRYVMYGNIKDKKTGSGVSYLFPFVTDAHKHSIDTPYGKRSNISIGVKFNSDNYKILHQTRM